MLEGSAELLAGIVQDPVFVPLVAFGPGGVFAELIDQAEFRIAPLTDADAHELVMGGKAGELIRGFRGKPAADQSALTDLLHRLSRLGEDLSEVAELDLNPVIASPDGCVAVDARVRVRPAVATPRTKLGRCCSQQCMSASGPASRPARRPQFARRELSSVHAASSFVLVVRSAPTSRLRSVP
jgi:hypothetical protein